MVIPVAAMTGESAVAFEVGGEAVIESGVMAFFFALSSFDGNNRVKVAHIRRRGHGFRL